MMLNLMVFVVGLLLIAVGIVGTMVLMKKYHDALDKYERRSWGCRDDDSIPKPNKPRHTKSILCIIIGCFILIASASFTVIPTGFTGVKTIFGQVNSKSLPNGFNFHIPFVESIKKVNNKQQDISFEDEIWSETSARTPVFYKEVTVTYTINPEYSAWIYANVSDYQDNLVSVGVVGSSLKAAAKTLSDEDATNRGKIEPLTVEYLQKSLDDKYEVGVVHINKVTIGNADYEESYNQALAKMQQAQIEKEQQDIINAKNVAQAQAEADAKVKAAEGAAEAKKIAAEAEAEANKKVADSLSPEILEKMFYDKWDGKLPYSMGGSTSIMDISGMIKEDAE